MDTNNTGFNISDNYFSHNWDVAIQYEISYNVSITDNTFLDNGWIAGPHNPGTGAIEINNSGSASSVSGPYNTKSVISGNVLTDNWGGVDIYEDSDRFCGTQSDNTSSDYCTLVNPSVYTVASCTAKTPPRATPEPEPRLLRQLPLERPEHRGHRQHAQPQSIGHWVRLHGCQRVRVRRPLLRVGHLSSLRRLCGAVEPGQQPERRLQRQHLQRPVRVRLHVPGRHRELGPVEWWVHGPKLECRHQCSRCRVHVQRGRDHSDYDHDHRRRPGRRNRATTTQHGYWLVGSDGGIFTFGAAQFYGSMGSLEIQRPVVGISPTSSRAGYWLVASDGGIFAFDAGFYGSLPGLGFNPAGSGLAHSLNAPIVGMVPSTTGRWVFLGRFGWWSLRFR